MIAVSVCSAVSTRLQWLQCCMLPLIVCVQEAILGRWTPGRRTWFSGNPELMMERRGIQTAETRAKIHEAKWSDHFFDIKR